ncbi:MAG: hypothetical protein CMK59_08545 [Proteobacteria bacterium]|nr:hypothetical protein [Pseudomonadota bacterium]
MVDLFLISSWVSSSIVQSILSGLFLSLFFMWGWWLRNHLWQQSAWVRLKDVFAELTQLGFELQPRSIYPKWCAVRRSDGRVLCWKLGFFQEHSHCSIEGSIVWIGSSQELIRQLESRTDDVPLDDVPLKDS